MVARGSSVLLAHMKLTEEQHGRRKQPRPLLQGLHGDGIQSKLSSSFSFFASTRRGCWGGENVYMNLGDVRI